MIAGGYPLAFKVRVAESYHYMDEDSSYFIGTFATLEVAVEVCKRIVDELLASAYEPGLSAPELYGKYTSFVEDPYILPPSPSDEITFSAWS